jgi:hypothetical protein
MDAVLKQWPIKLRDISIVAPYFHRASLLIAADCAAYAYPAFHGRLTEGKTLVITCPCNEALLHDRVRNILVYNDILDVTLVKVSSDCCAVFPVAVMNAIKNSGKDIPLRMMTVFPDGEVVD